MLVLRRKNRESIVIRGTIIVTVLAVEGDRLKIGITAPPEVRIVRGELLAADGVDPALLTLPPPAERQQGHTP